MNNNINITQPYNTFADEDENANQCAGGTVSIHTLWYLLRVTEHLWSCTKCNDIDC